LDRYTAPYENFVPGVRYGHERRHGRAGEEP